MPEPQIILGGDLGFHNADLEASEERLEKGKQYRDLSTVCVVPTRGMIPARVVENWMGLMTPMNNAFFRIFVSGMEVGEAYNQAVEVILAHEQLSKFKYLLTLEEDNMPPPDGLLKLYESIDGYAAVGGLYWTKGEGGQPMIYGDPKGVLSFQPQQVQLDTRAGVQRAGDGLHALRHGGLPGPEDPQAVVQDGAGVGPAEGRGRRGRRISTSSRTRARPATGWPATLASR